MFDISHEDIVVALLPIIYPFISAVTDACQPLDIPGIFQYKNQEH